MSTPTQPTSDLLSRLKRYAEQNKREPWIPVKATELMALIAVADAANGVCIAQDGYLVELVDALYKLEAL